MNPDNPSLLWLWAAIGVTLALIPAGVACFRAQPEDRLVALEALGGLIAIDMLVFAEAYHRPSFFDVPLTLAVLSFGSGMVFTRFIQRWL